MKSKIIFGALLLTFVASAATAQAPLFPSKARIDALQHEQDWGGLRHVCASALRLESHPVADYSPPPHYTLNGPRAEKASDPEPTLRRESMAVYHLSLCYELSKNTKYSAQAEKLLEGWAHTTTRIGTPQGKDGFNFYFPFAEMGAELLREDAGWNGDDMSRFVRDIVVPANNAANNHNHGNWGVLLLATSAGYLHDHALMERARDRWMELMRSQVAADGSLPLEICRSDTNDYCGGPHKGIKGIAYTQFDLEPSTIAAEIFLNAGMSVYPTPAGALLCKAYDKVAGWTLHPESFPYYKSNHGKLIGIYNIDYFYVLQSHCPTADGAAVIAKYGAEQGDPMELRAMYEK